MSSNTAPRRHLDATAGREVVFCWNCRNEWYRDEQEGLGCPRCHGEITEIITPGEADPREPELPVPAFLLGHQHEEHDSDSDPEEDDIEQHIHHTPHGFFMRRTDPNPGSNRDGSRRAPGSPPNADPHDDIMRSFTDMLFTFNGGRPNQPGPNPEGVVPGREDRNVHVAGPHTIQGRTWRSGPFEVSAVSVVIPGPGAAPPGNNGAFGAPPDFNAFLTNILGGQQPPRQGHDDGEPGQQGPVPLPGLPGALGRIFAAYLNPANAVHGDAVFTQEAFDRVITQMMEANPQSNAAPPASQEAISKLETRKLDDKDLGTEGKAECTICIDDMHKGDEVTVLPCKHWFHGECVTLWLKEHNTCPICRTPIEAGNNNTNTGGQQQQQQSSQDPAPSGPRNPQTARSRYGNFRTQGENEDRLNAIRNLGGLGRAYRSYDPYQPTAPSTQGQQQRRSSMSPPPDPSASREFRSRSRERAGGNNDQRSPPPPMSGYSQQPAEGGRNQDGDDDRRSGNSSREGGNGNGHGPLSWFRDQWSRHSSSGSGNGSGDRRRP